MPARAGGRGHVETAVTNAVESQVEPTPSTEPTPAAEPAATAAPDTAEPAPDPPAGAHVALSVKDYKEEPPQQDSLGFTTAGGTAPFVYFYFPTTDDGSWHGLQLTFERYDRELVLTGVRRVYCTP